MKKYFDLPAFTIALVVSSLIAGTISYFSELNFWIILVIILVAMVINGFIAEAEDNVPGGFNNPTPNILLEHKLTAINELIGLLTNSQNSVYADTSVKDLIEQARIAKTAIESSDNKATMILEMLFAPTGPLQDTSFDNG